MAGFTWYGQECEARLRAELLKRLKVACLLVQSHARKLISVEGSGRWTKDVTVSVEHSPSGRNKWQHYVRYRHKILSGKKAGLMSKKGRMERLVQARRGLRGMGKLVRHAFPSLPGDPPHRQTGDLASSVQIDVSDAGGKPVGKVGTNLRKGRWLELGTKKMAARPWLRRAFLEKIPAVRQIISAYFDVTGGH